MNQFRKTTRRLNLASTQISKELLFARMIFECYCRLQAFYYLKKMQKIKDLQVRSQLYHALANRPGEPRYNEEFPEDNPEFPKEDSDDYEAYPCLTDFLLDNTVTFSEDYIEHFLEHGESTPISKILCSDWKIGESDMEDEEQENYFRSKTILLLKELRSYLKDHVLNKRNARLAEKQLEEGDGFKYKEKEDFRHQTLIVRDMVLTCTTHNFSEDQDCQKTSVLSGNDEDLKTYQQRFPGTRFHTWYALKDDIKSKFFAGYFPSKIWTTEELYSHMSELNLIQLSSTAALEIHQDIILSEQEEQMSYLYPNISGHQTPGTSRSNVRRQASGSGTGEGSSHDRRFCMPKGTISKALSIRNLRSRKRGNPDSSDGSYDRLEIPLPSSTDVGANDKATSTTDDLDSELSESNRIIEKKSVLSSGIQRVAAVRRSLRKIPSRLLGLN